MRRNTILLMLAFLVQAMWGPSVRGQTPSRTDVDAYFRAVAEHFHMAAAEVGIISEWELPPDEVPVAIFVAQRAGVSPDALVVLQRTGRSWSDLADRYGVDAGAFHLALDEGVELGALERAYQAYRDTPRSQWGMLTLTEEEIVFLVNLRVLSDLLGLDPGPVLQARARTGSWVTTYRDLSRGGAE